MKQRSIYKSLQGLRSYVFTLLVAVPGFSFLVTEWHTIFRTGQDVYHMFKPVMDSWAS
ncbi:MAG: hypothetical protein ABIR30_07005 [Chitinophagaceae bacterium]